MSHFKNLRNSNRSAKNNESETIKNLSQNEYLNQVLDNSSNNFAN